MTARYIVSLDPGSRRAGLAVLDTAAGGAAAPAVVAVRGFELPGRDVPAMIAALVEFVRETVDPAAGDLVVEWPRKYASHRAAWDDVEDLRTVARAVEALGWASVRRVAPGTWASTTPKHIRHNRVAARLGPVRCVRLGWSDLSLDARDAIALGLWAYNERRTP